MLNFLPLNASSTTPPADVPGPSHSGPSVGLASGFGSVENDYQEEDVDDESVLSSGDSQLSPGQPPPDFPGTVSGQVGFSLIIDRASRLLELPSQRSLLQ